MKKVHTTTIGLKERERGGVVREGMVVVQDPGSLNRYSKENLVCLFTSFVVC
jgi:hypothetical protein